MTDEGLARVVLAISSFRSDEAVCRLLERVFDRAGAGFGAVILVDSLGSGAIETAITQNGWPVRYVNADRNLGSAGNLALRLELAASSGLDWCYAVNHDGEVDKDNVEALLELGQSRKRVGAVYPQLVLTSADHRVDAPRVGFEPFARLREADRDEGSIEVAWSSSNGALYNLDAVRGGVKVWADLWMGWEDLALGWDLRRAGWRQLRSNSVTIADNYEYRRVSLFGRQFFTAEKPAWYSYYQLRNLLLIARRTRFEAVSLGSLARRIIADIALTLFVRPQKLRRFSLLAQGLADGLRGRTGHGPVP